MNETPLYSRFRRSIGEILGSHSETSGYVPEHAPRYTTEEQRTGSFKKLVKMVEENSHIIDPTVLYPPKVREITLADIEKARAILRQITEARERRERALDI